MANENKNISGEIKEVGAIADPDCLRCMRKKLRATSLVVFFRNPDGSWRLDNFQGDKPMNDAEAEFQYMLQAGLPETVLGLGKSFFISDDAGLARTFPRVANLFNGNAVIAAAVRRAQSFGVRLAWRDQTDPFNQEDLKTIECFGECPDDCI